MNLGTYYETQACNFLEAQGLQLLARNWRVRFGEIDIIMLDDDVIVFVEVRYRKNSDFGHAIETVTKQKQDRIRRVAQAYLGKQKTLQTCRFDVIGISGGKLEWVKGAF